MTEVRSSLTVPESSVDVVTQAVHKTNSVSGRPAGWLKKVRLETFFIFAKTNKKF